MDLITRRGFQNPDTINIEPEIRSLANNGLFVTGPGVLSSHLGCDDNLYIVSGDERIGDPAKKLKSLFHVAPVNQRIGLYTNHSGSYFLCYNAWKPNIVVHTSDICLTDQGLMTNQDVKDIQESTYKNWKPYVMDTVTVPLYLYFLNQNKIELDVATLDHVLKHVCAINHNDANSTVVAPTVESDKFETYFELYRNMF